MGIPKLNKKQLLVLLLAAACLLIAVLLVISSPPERNTLNSLEVIDRTIYQSFSAYGAPRANFREHSHQVDSLFTRKSYQIRVIPGYPSTAAHLKLAGALRPYGVTVEGRRFFPENTLQLDIIYSGKLVRRVNVRTDSSLLLPAPVSDRGEKGAQ
jgi:hypothetical protein